MCWDLGRRGFAADKGRGGSLDRGSRVVSFLPIREEDGDDGEDWLELCPESE